MSSSAHLQAHRLPVLGVPLCLGRAILGWGLSPLFPPLESTVALGRFSACMNSPGWGLGKASEKPLSACFQKPQAALPVAQGPRSLAHPALEAPQLQPSTLSPATSLTSFVYVLEQWEEGFGAGSVI